MTVVWVPCEQPPLRLFTRQCISCFFFFPPFPSLRARLIYHWFFIFKDSTTKVRNDLPFFAGSIRKRRNEASKSHIIHVKLDDVFLRCGPDIRKRRLPLWELVLLGTKLEQRAPWPLEGYEAREALAIRFSSSSFLIRFSSLVLEILSFLACSS